MRLFAVARTLDDHRFLFTKHLETGPLPRLPSPGNGHHLVHEIDTVHETLEEGNRELGVGEQWNVMASSTLRTLDAVKAHHPRD